MLTVKSIVVKDMRRITLIMVAVILFLSTAIQVFNTRKTAQQNAQQVFSQVEQILDENSKELERVRAEYNAMCLNDARTVAYILKHNPGARDDVEELNKIAANIEVDEIHIFNADGVIMAGTHPQYFGLSFDSGAQIKFFKPLLTDKSLELVQDITPNTADGNPVQYSALWSEDRTFIVQVGMYPETVLRATEKNELSYIFSLLRTGVGYSLYAVDPDTEQVVGAASVSDVGRSISEMGLQKARLEAEGSFHARLNGVVSHCFSKQIGGSYIIWSMSIFDYLRTIALNDLLLLAGLLLISLILTHAVSTTMDKTVIDQIKRSNESLRAIQNGDLTTKVDVGGSKEFFELSAHINSMVASLLHSSEKLELSEQIKSQKEELERQHEQLEAALKRAETASKAKTDFLFNMSHDIRTPMNAILGFTNLALESGDLETQREYLKNIEFSSKQLLDIINNILELSRIQDRRVLVEEDLVNVKETCAKLCTIFDSDLKNKNQSFSMVQEITHPYMYVDTNHYTQIFLNIVSNAIKYTPEGGAISISVRELPGEETGTCFLETAIQDNGIGMSEEFLAQAYESFSRERTSTVSGVQGTGLGLAIVKELVELLHGEIHIESRQGVGTKVTVRLPHRLGQAPKEADPIEAQALTCTLLNGRRVLLAEDIDINAVIATKLLTSKGLIVERARDGVECVDMVLKADAGYYDLVLMDIQMPNMDGYRASQSIRAFEDKEKASIPILAMTANVFKEDCDKASEAGMNGHIAKPLDVSTMFGTISEALRPRNDG